MKIHRRTAVSLAAAQLMAISGLALAQSDVAPKPAPAASQAGSKDSDKKQEATQTVVVSGQRAAIASAQRIKQDADEMVDAIVADDIGKLPDRSITEALQRVVGITMDRTMARGDPEHFSVEGSGIAIRGLSYVRSELNGRDSFSANNGRSLSFEDVPPELMSAVEVYKNPSAEQIEGGIGGLVNLKTALPFDYKGFKASLSAQWTDSKLRGGKLSPSFSGLISNRWDTDLGQFGALIDFARSESATRTDGFQIDPYYPRSDVVAGRNVWVPAGAQWRTLEFDRTRQGLYGAVQWKKNDLQSNLTYFQSDYKMNWSENALTAHSNPYTFAVGSGALYNQNGALLYGTLTNPGDGGINFGTSNRVANRTQDTKDLSWQLTWKANERWGFRSDLQFVNSSTKAFDSTVELLTKLDQETVDLRGSFPKITFNAADTARLADPGQYFWGSTMEHFDQAKAKAKSWRGDAKYVFEDDVLQDLRFGLRFTERDATNIHSNPDYNWQAITQPWQVGWDISHPAYLSDPRFAGPNRAVQFNRFFNGRASLPTMIFPDPSIAANYPNSYAELHKFHDVLCAEQAAAQGWSSGCSVWQAAALGTDPSSINRQQEKTQTAFAQLRFAWDNLPYPVDGNVGLRAVRTETKADGYTVFNAQQVPAGAVGVAVPVIASFAEAQGYKNSYTKYLPSLNLRMKVTPQLQFRAALSQGMARPDFSQLQAYTTMGQNFTSSTDANGVTTINSVTRTGSASGNPLLKPTMVKQADLSAEWYFERTGSLTVAAFSKNLSDIVTNQSFVKQLPDATGTLQDFIVTGPVNGAKGYARGIEFGFQKYFDKLPGALAGLGVQVNYTYVDSKQSFYNPASLQYCAGANTAANVNLSQNGCDTNGLPFGGLPLQNLSKNAYNLALLYDRGPISARLAYSWRSRYLQGVNVNGTSGGDGVDANPQSPTYGQHNVGWALPVWADSHGQVDLGVFYKVSDNLTIGLEGQNITDTVFRQLMQQHSGMMERALFTSGPRYTAQVRYSF